MTVELRRAQNNDAKGWDEIISPSPHGTIFHQWDWLNITEKHTQSKLYPLIGSKNGIPVGVFPLFFQKKGPVRMVFSPPPHAALFYLGPAMAGGNTAKQEMNYIAFQDSVEHFIRNDLKAQYVSISLPPALQDPRPFAWSGYSIEPRYDYVIDLSIGPDSLLKTLDKKQRQNLNRAKNRGFSVETGGKKEYEMILDLMDIRYAQQGKSVTESRNYFLDIYEAYKNNLKIFVVNVDGEVVTGSIDLQYRDTHYSWIGSPKPKIPLSPSPNDLLLWESILCAHEQGCTSYVTLGAAGNKRLHAYYAAKFNPELRIRYVATRKSFLAGIVEKGYTTILKPLRGKAQHLNAGV
jgi:CelD/BcsL family acetyltransferase involved in cellulose biosynthesis